MSVVIASDVNGTIRGQTPIGLRHGQQVAGVEGDDRWHVGHFVQGGCRGEALGDQQRTGPLHVADNEMTALNAAAFLELLEASLPIR